MRLYTVSGNHTTDKNKHSGSGKTYYKNKEKIAKLEEENKRLKELNEKKEELHVEFADKPSEFLFTSTANNQEIYTHLKLHPEDSKFIFKKYKDNQDFIKELCDPENHTLYLEGVANQLKDTYKIQDLNDQLSELNVQISKKITESNNLTKTIKDKEQKENSLELEVDKLTVDKETLSISIRNIYGQEGFQKVTDFLTKMAAFMKNVDEKTPLTSKLTNSLFMERAQVIEFANLYKEAIEIRQFIETKHPSDEELATMKTDTEVMQESISLEYEKAKNSLDAFMSKNPKKQLRKLTAFLSTGNEQLGKATFKGGSEPVAIFPRILYNALSENFSNAFSVAGRLDQQLENVNSLKESETSSTDVIDRISHSDSNDIKGSIEQTGSTDPAEKIVDEPLPFTEHRDNFERLREMNDDLESDQSRKKRKFWGN